MDRQFFIDRFGEGGEELRLLDALDIARLPRHVAIIMDGNGRWAVGQGKPREEGHRVGAESVRAVTETCAALGIEQLTLYAFSVENWKRPKAEIRELMKLLRRYVKEELPTLQRNGIRFRAIGRLGGLDAITRRMVSYTQQVTAANPGMCLNIALNYGGRSEIADAAAAIAFDVAAGRLDPKAVDEGEIERRLYTAGFPDPDLLVRTSGECRVSNFLLWQIAYAEFVVTPVLWPDFRGAELLRCIGEYQKRERRFGGLAEE